MIIKFGHLVLNTESIRKVSFMIVRGRKAKWSEKRFLIFGGASSLKYSRINC